MNLISYILVMALIVIFNLQDSEAWFRRRRRSRRVRIRIRIRIRIGIRFRFGRKRRGISDTNFNELHQEIRGITHQELAPERKRRNAEAQDASNLPQIGLQRKRRDVDNVTSSGDQCACSDGVQLSRCSMAALEKMNGHHYDMSIKRFYDPNGVPVYDVMKFTPGTGTAGPSAPDEHYLTTITNECDCTSVLKPGNITIYGQVQSGQLVHGALTNSDKFLEHYVLNTALIGGVVGGLLVLLLAASVALMVKRRRSNAKCESDQKSENHTAGVDNGAYEVKTVHG